MIRKLIILLLIVGCATEPISVSTNAVIPEDYWSCTYSECCSPNQTLEYDSTADSIIFHSTWGKPEICANECNLAQVTICTLIPNDPFTSADDDTFGYNDRYSEYRKAASTISNASRPF